MKKKILFAVAWLVSILTGQPAFAETQTVSDPAIWTFDAQTAGISISTLTDMDGLYLRGSSARPVEIQALPLSGTFSDGIAWNVQNVAYARGSGIGNHLETNPVADFAVDGGSTGGCLAFTTTQAGRVYVVMKSHSNSNSTNLSLYFGGQRVDSVLKAKNTETYELTYKAKEAGTFFISGDNYYSVAVVRFVPDLKTFSLTAPSNCFTYVPLINLDLRESDLQAYVASSVGDSEVTMSRIRKVPAMTGVVMVGEAGRTYELPVLKGTMPDVGRNLLTPTMQATTVLAEVPGTTSSAYHHNSDEFAAELVRRWQDYWQERPGQGTAVNSGGAKIHFSDSQTHTRGVENFRTSGVVDPMRLPKDAFYVQQAIWDGWVDDLKDHTYICGHWNYDEGQTIPRIYVVSTSPAVKLTLPGGTTLEATAKEGDFLYRFDNVAYAPGTLTAIGYSASGTEQSRYALQTAGEAARLVLTTHEHPTGWKADGADLALIDVEVQDASGRRCPLDNREVSYTLEGPAEWLGGVAHGSTQELGERWSNDNYVRSTVLPVEAGINRVMMRSKPTAGTVTLTATADGLTPVSVQLTTQAIETTGGLGTWKPADGLPSVLDRGETPSEPSFTQSLVAADVKSVTAGSGSSPEATLDGSESTTWTSGNTLETAYITYTLAAPTKIRQISMKTGSARYMSYPVAVEADGVEVFRGHTGKTLGYCRLTLADTCPAATNYTIRMIGESTSGDAFGDVTELDGTVDDQPSSSYVLRISAIELLKEVEK